MGRIAASREPLMALGEKVARYQTHRATARAEALIAAEQRTERERLEIQRDIVEKLAEKHSVSAISDATGLGRSTVYKWRDEYLALIGTEDLTPDNPWGIQHDVSGEFILTHAKLGEWRAVFEADETLTVHQPGGIYRPISRENEDVRDGGEWTPELEKAYAPLREAFDAWRDAGEPMKWSIQ